MQDQLVQLHRRLIAVRGPDAAEFLNRLITNSIRPDEPIHYAALLSPQGKVRADFFVWAADDGFLLDVAAARAELLAQALNLYRLRANIAIAPLDGGVFWSPEPIANAQPDPRGPFGWRLLAPPQTPPPEADPLAARRAAWGLPDLAIDAEIEEVFGLEALLEELNGVDFHKGCFIGQENVSRMKRRATTRKKFCRIAFEGPPPPFGALVTAGEAELGSVRTIGEGRAIALLRLDRALAAAEPLLANGAPLRLDLPDWLSPPEIEDGT